MVLVLFVDLDSEWRRWSHSKTMSETDEISDFGDGISVLSISDPRASIQTGGYATEQTVRNYINTI